RLTTRLRLQTQVQISTTFFRTPDMANTSPIQAKRLSNMFSENLTKPALRTDLPALLDRIEKTEQLIYCSTLLTQASLLTATAGAGDGTTTTISTTTIAPQMKTTLTDKELQWLVEMDKNPMGKARIHWLATRM
ncbi:hypothetical protein BGZ95_005495, partial [Linnemannia exigua]